jgi:hypothetical protein
MLTAKTYLSTILKLRLLVGFLGERAQFDWWSTSFYGDYSLRSLEFVTPKTSFLAQYYGVLEAARILHDEHLNVGSYHLFRLPEEVEQDLHTLMQDNIRNDFVQHLPQDKETAIEALSGLSGEKLSSIVGPVAIGKVDQLDTDATLRAIASGYFSAFTHNTKIYPYLVNQ